MNPINVYKIRSKERLKKLAALMNNFYQDPCNQNMEDKRVYFYFTNSEGMSMVEINPEEVTYRYATFDDFQGNLPYPRSHKETLDYLLKLSTTQYWTDFNDKINREYSFQTFKSNTIL